MTFVASRITGEVVKLLYNHSNRLVFHHFSSVLLSDVFRKVEIRKNRNKLHSIRDTGHPNVPDFFLLHQDPKNHSLPEILMIMLKQTQVKT